MSSYTREDVTFDSDGTPCAAWLYRPDRAQPPPIVVMAHGFAAIRALRLDAYATRFAQTGYAVLVFDYRGWGDSAGQPRRVLDINAQHADWRAAITHARTSMLSPAVESSPGAHRSVAGTHCTSPPRTTRSLP
jgi:dienelactone hydrolase